MSNQYVPQMPVLRLPNPPNDYSYQWMNQYTRALEVQNQQLVAALQILQKMVVPNYTTASKTTLPNIAGQVVFDTTLGKLCVNNGSGWETVTST
jgi:hypothetical protein